MDGQLSPMTRDLLRRFEANGHVTVPMEDGRTGVFRKGEDGITLSDGSGAVLGVYPALHVAFAAFVDWLHAERAVH